MIASILSRIPLGTIRRAAAVFLLAAVVIVGWGMIAPQWGGGAAMAAPCSASLPGSTPCMDMGGESSLAEVNGRRALYLIDYSLGLGNNNNCFTCTFIQQFLVAMASFSAAVFMYFRAYFVTLMPFVMAIWMAWAVGRVMIAGGDGGGAFFAMLVRKFTLFFFLWLLMMVAGPTGNPARNPSLPMTPITSIEPWESFGPLLLNYGMKLSNEVRTTASTNLSAGGSTIRSQLGMNCRGIGTMSPTLTANPSAYEFAFHASEMACAIERIHIVGIGAGVAMIESSWRTIQVDVGWGMFMQLIAGLFNAMIITCFGLMILGAYGFSMIWFAFLILDVVVKVLIIAGIAPILMILALLIPTRGYAIKAITQSLGAVATLVGVAFVSALAFYLIANVVEVYNTAKAYYDPTLPTIARGNLIANLRAYIAGLQTEPGQPGHIPIDLSTPWFHYMLLTSLSVSVLGKKVIGIIESIVGAPGMTQMADNARKVAIAGSVMAATTAYFGARGGIWTAKKGITGGAAAVGAAGHAAQFANSVRAHGLAQTIRNNPFGNRDSAPSSDKGYKPSILQSSINLQRELDEKAENSSGGRAPPS